MMLSIAAMKKILTTLLAAGMFVCGASAEFETWTNQEGNTARMKLIEVVKDGDKTTGKFELEDGRSIELDAATFDEESAGRLRAWEPKPDLNSVFDDMLNGNLVILDGRRFRDHELAEKPEKFYIFYYTASWCPPCRAYTPDLVKFYQRQQRRNGNLFELILVTSDRDQDAMLKYARDAKMPWPQVTFDKAREIRAELDHGVRGIPSVIVCDLEGNVVSRDRNLDNLERLLSQ